MSRLFVPGLPVETLVANSLSPRRFTWDQTQHKVERIEDYWQTDFGWWRNEGYIARDYFLLTTNTGLLVVIYHSLTSDFWYLERVHD